MTPEELATQVPSLEELYTTASLPAWTNSSGVVVANRPSSFRMTLFAATGIPVRILAVACVWEYWSLAASDTNYWQAVMEIGAGGSWPDYAARSTQNTGPNANGAITARVPWTFDAAALLADPIVTPGQCLALNWFANGTVAPFEFPFVATIRYQPV